MTRTSLKHWIWVSLALIACGGKSAPKSTGAAAPPTSPPSEPVVAAAVSPTPSPAVGGAYEYGLGPDDVLQIDIWKNPDLSKEVTVRPDGFISLPLVNDVRVKGFTATDLAQILKERYKDFVDDPEVSVTVKVANSYKIFVLGKVTTSGMFLLKTPITVLQAISMAGGFTPFASTSDITVLRKQEGTEKRYRVNYGDIVKGKRTEQNLVLIPGDTVIVP